jgi:hypothetical protein
LKEKIMRIQDVMSKNVVSVAPTTEIAVARAASF